MSDKVKLTKEQAQTIEYFKESDDWTESSLVEAHAYNPNRWEDSASPINGMPLDTLIRALYTPEDVEIEKTPEEELLHIYESYANEDNDFDENVRTGIEIALRTLGIKIPGIQE